MNASSFHDTVAYTEHVDGVIVGGDCLRGDLFYHGRQQGRSFYGATAAELTDRANAFIEERRVECGEAFALIWPDRSGWSLRIRD